MVTVAGALVIVHLWNLDLMGMASRAVGGRVAGALVDIGVTLMLAYLVWQLAKTAIDQRLEREAGPAGRERPGRGRRDGRVAAPDPPAPGARDGLRGGLHHERR